DGKTTSGRQQALMRFVIITGVSGSGKTLALHSMEDAGYFAIDNLPPSLLPALVTFVAKSAHPRVAVNIDARSGEEFGDLPTILSAAPVDKSPVEILFIDASDEAL